MKDYYKILDIPFNSDLIIIKKAYRQLALKFHPDKNKGSNAHEIFVEITEAYEVLGNEESRKKYDILYERLFTQSQEITAEDITVYREWQHKANKKAEEYRKKSYDDFSTIMNDFTFHTSNYAKIGCRSEERRVGKESRQNGCEWR